MLKFKILENILDIETNNIVIEELRNNCSWKLADDSNDQETGYSDQGFNSLTYTHAPNKIVYPNDFLNSIATLIFKKVVTKVEEEPDQCIPVRFLFNYYNTGSEGRYHIDNPDPRSKSIVYYFNDCDGGTFVEDDFIESKNGRAVVFDSNLNHKGAGPRKFKQRFVLNIIYLRGIND